MILEATPLTEAQTSDAVTNYIECLNLPEGSDAIIVTDKTPDLSNTNAMLRVKMSSMLLERIENLKFQTKIVTFDSTMSKDQLFRETQRTLQSLHSDKPATIIYIGDSWLNREGIYNAATAYGKTHDVRVAGSLGFSHGDARVLSQMDADRRAVIKKTNEYFETFLADHPRGTFVVSTKDDAGTEYFMGVPYDTSEAPFVSSLGVFDSDTHIVDGFKYTNIPSGEMYGAPYKFKHAFGIFMAQGIRFTVYDGFVSEIKATPEAIENITDLSQIELLRIIAHGGKIPLSELGLGLYNIAGIPTYSDSSVLTGEKGDIHFGMATAPSDTSEGDEMKDYAGDFHHTDFVMNNPTIIHYDPDAKEESQFYPPLKK